MSGAQRKRQLFQTHWGPSYLFVEKDGCAVCLVCRKEISTLRQYNISRHYQLHADDYKHVSTDEDRQKLYENLVEITACDKDDTDDGSDSEISESEACVRASYKIAHLIAKNCKNFSDGDFVKECAIAETMFPENVELIKSVSLSRRTVSRRIIQLAANLERQLQKRCSEFIAYSVALDESTDVVDTAQLAIFVRGTNNYLQVTEEMLDVVGLKHTTTGEDIFDALDGVLNDAGLSWEKMESVTTDSAPAMRGSIKGWVCRIRAKLNREVPAIHCLLHQENLCAQTLQMSHVMKVFVKTVNNVRAHGLKHRQFQEFLKDLESDYPDIPYFTEVRWLSRGKVLARFFYLWPEVSLFMDMQGAAVPELENSTWKCDLVFLCDIVGHLNSLNLILQGRDMLITTLIDSVRSFVLKLSLWISQFKSGLVVHFEKLKLLEGTWSSSDLERYGATLEKLKAEFEQRFQESGNLEELLKVFATPFALQEVHEVPAEFQLELLDLRCDREIEEKYRSRRSLQQFYDGFSRERFPRLHKNAAKVLCMFGTTYTCEQFFSLQKLSKPKRRSCLIDVNLKATLRIAAAQSITPNIDEIIRHRCQKSKTAP